MGSQVSTWGASVVHLLQPLVEVVIPVGAAGHLLEHDGQRETENVGRRGQGDLVVERRIPQRAPRGRRRLHHGLVVDEIEAVEGHAGKVGARHQRLRVQILDMRRHGRVDRIEQAFVGAGLGDRDVHHGDVDLRRALLRTQRAEDRGGIARRVVDHLDVGVGLHERLDHRLGVEVLEQAGVAGKGDGRFGGRRRSGESKQRGDGNSFDRCQHSMIPDF